MAVWVGFSYLCAETWACVSIGTFRAAMLNAEQKKWLFCVVMQLRHIDMFIDTVALPHSFSISVYPES
jgi:hypothetical protein